LSDALWRRRFHADPDIVGKTIRSRVAVPVVGVMAPDLSIRSVRLPHRSLRLMVPPDERVRHPNNISIYLSTIARLKPASRSRRHR
jgi:hypothetical protein